MGGESAVADLEIHRRAAAHDLGRFVGADEPAGALRTVGVDIERNGNARAQRAEHIERKIAHGVDAVRAALLEQPERCAVAMSAVGARLEHRVRGQLAGFPRLVEHPEQPLVVYEQPPDTEIAHALRVLESADELFLAAQPVADDGALPRKACGGGVIRGPRADRHGERSAAVAAERGIFEELRARMAERPERFVDAVDRDAETLRFAQQRLCCGKGVHRGDLHAELRSAGKCRLRGRKRVQIAPRQTQSAEKRSRFIHHNGIAPYSKRYKKV